MPTVPPSRDGSPVSLPPSGGGPGLAQADGAPLAAPMPAAPPRAGEILHFAIPLMLSLMTTAINAVVDTLFIGHLGTAPLAAVPLAAGAYMVGWLFAVGLMRNAIAFCGRLYGAGRPQGIGAVLVHYHLLVVVAVPLLAGYVLLWPLVTARFGLDAEVARLSRTYLFIRVGDVVFSLLVALYSAFYQATGNSRLPMAVNVGIVAANIALDYALIFGHWGLPALGVAGSALATVLAQACGAVLILAIAYGSADRRRYGLRVVAPLERPLLREILRVGVPAGLGDGLEVAIWIGFMLLVGRLGQVSLAASNIGMQVTALLFLPGFAFGIAGASYIGRFLGAGQPDVARRTALRVLLMAVGYMGLLGVPLWFLGEPLARLFTTEPLVVHHTALVLKVMAVYQVFDAMGFVVRTALGGAGDTRVPLLAMVAAGVLVLYPATLLLAAAVEPPVMGAWLGAFAYLVVYALAMQWRFHRGAWMRIRLAV